MKRTWISLLLSVILLLSSASFAIAEEEPIVITYAAFRDLANNDSWAVEQFNEIMKKYGFNVKLDMITYGTYDGAEWKDKFVMDMASGTQPPDVMLLGELWAEGLRGGWYAELDSEFVHEHAPVYSKEIDDRFPLLWGAGKDATTGQLYAIPEFNMYGPNRHVFVYRQDWLDKLGIEVPKTMDDFENYLRLCRKTDFNGNGQLDEYGYTCEDKAFGIGFSEIFGAYGNVPGMWLYNDEENTVYRGDVSPVNKEGLKLLVKWYAEDLIPQGVMTTSKDRDSFYAGTLGAFGSSNCYGPAVAKGGYIWENMQAIEGAKLTVALGPVANESVAPVTFEHGPVKYVLAFGSHLEDDKEKLAAILSMFDTIASEPELFEYFMFGKRGIVWDFAQGDTGAVKYLDKYTDVTLRLSEIGVRDLSESALCPFWVQSVYANYIDAEALSYASMYTGKYDVLLKKVTGSTSMYLNDLIILTKQAYIDIITGAKPIEYFDEFVAQWYQNGGEVLTQEANDLYKMLNK